jgi:hypothetical protein
MKIKTADLEKKALDWAVAICEGYQPVYPAPEKASSLLFRPREAVVSLNDLQYSTDWKLYGQIITREGIDTRQIKRKPYAIFEQRHFDASKGDEIVRLPGYKCDMVRRPVKPGKYDGKWMAQMSDSSSTIVSWKIDRDFLSDTPIIAAMRCYVASKLGLEVEIPNELLTLTRCETSPAI